MRLSQKAKILNLLLGGKLVKMQRLNAIAYRYSARISELRGQGYKIDTVRIRGNEFAYRLTA